MTAAIGKGSPASCSTHSESRRVTDCQLQQNCSPCSCRAAGSYLQALSCTSQLSLVVFFPSFYFPFFFFSFFLDTHTQSFQIPKAHSIIKHKQLRRETSLPLQFRCPVKAFLCTDSLQARSATVNWRLTDILVRAHAVCPHFADKRQMGNNSWNSKNIHFPNQQH